MTGDRCGCCETTPDRIPELVTNRPALTAVAFRIGTFATFRQSILDRLAAVLPTLRTRRSDDYTITAVELWAAVADVLTFYQERIANDAYLRTARERDAVLRLARLLGYQLRPGASATALLAFTVERGRAMTIPAGLRVQSVPAEEEKPQKYETLEPLAADARLDRVGILPPPRAATPLAPGSTGAWLAPGDEMLAAAAALSAGDTLLLHRTHYPATDDIVERFTLERVAMEGDRARIEWSPAIRTTADWPADTTARRTTGTLQLFGHGAPEAFMALVTPTSGTAFWANWRTSFDYATTSGELYLDGVHPEIVPGTKLLIVDRAAVPHAHAREVEVTDVATMPGPALSSTWINPPTPIPTGITAPSAPVAGTATRLHVTPAALSFPDRRQVSIHVLDGPPLRFWPYDYPDYVAQPSLWVSGRRAGWDAIEIGRGAKQGRPVAGEILRPADIPVGRTVLLTDAAGATASAAIAGARLAGLDLRVADTADDVTTGQELGLTTQAAARATALVSSWLPDTPFGAASNPLRELTVTIGDLPQQTIRLDGVSPDNLAYLRTTLEQRIRAALPDAPAFAEARVIDTGSQQVLVVVPGAPGVSLAFGPSARDATTVVELGLDAAHARWADGVLSAPLAPRATLSAATPSLELDIALLAPRIITLPHVLPSPAGRTPAEWAALLAAQLQPHVRGGLTDPLAARAIVAPMGDRILLLPGIPDEPVAEYLVLDVTTSAALALARTSAAMLGNVALASHGETVRPETLGDGDASAAFQHFALAKKPVTHLPGPADDVAPSSLELLVGGVRWTRVPTLYGRGPTEEVYVTHFADDGTVTVQGGDGTTGAHFPTGRANLIARYRQGLGLAGRVRAGALGTLLDRPQGLKGVTNPLPSDGGADPESLETARENAPGTVRTFGRAVSLRDFEDIVRASGEVAKSLATWVWTGSRRVVHVTVAGQLGARFSDEALARLHETLDRERDINVPLRLSNYRPVPIVVEATLRVDERRVVADVLAAGRAALLEALSFRALAFGAAVNLSDIYRALQDVDGVVSVDIDRLQFKNQSTAFLTERGADAAPVQGRLVIFPARPPAGPHGEVQPAEQAQLESPSQDALLRAVGGLSAGERT